MAYFCEGDLSIRPMYGTAPLESSLYYHGVGIFKFNTN